MVVGDFNMNGAELPEASSEKLREAEPEAIYKSSLPLIRDEYKTLLKALKSPKDDRKYKIIDCLRQTAGVSPITFADVIVDFEDNETPLNPELFG